MEFPTDVVAVLNFFSLQFIWVSIAKWKSQPARVNSSQNIVILVQQKELFISSVKEGVDRHLN